MQRFLCKACDSSFSSQTNSSTYNQKRPDLNSDVIENISEGVGVRKTAQNLRTSISTVQRKIRVLADVCDKYHKEVLATWKTKKKVSLMFDELDTFEQNRVHKIRIPVIVEEKSYFFIDAFPYDEVSGSHYPYLKDAYNDAHKEEFKKIPQYIKKVLKTATLLSANKVTVHSDMKPGYSKLIKEVFGEGVEHKEYKATVIEGGCKELFPINNTHACLRAEKPMLRRKSWYFTKEKDFLEDHLKIYIFYYNYFRKKGYTIGHRENKNRTKIVEFKTPAQKLGLLENVVDPRYIVGR